LTSNRSIGEWGTVFGDPVVATAILDRLLHHGHVITIRGDSYRLKEKRRKRASAKTCCSRNKVGEKNLSAARTTASRSLATALWMARSLAACFTPETRGVNSSCRPGANSGCRLTPRAGTRRGSQRSVFEIVVI